MLERKEFERLLQESMNVIAKYRAEDLDLWSEVEEQVKYIKQLYLSKLEKSNYYPGKKLELTYGPILSSRYDSALERNEMDPLYAVYNEGLRLELMHSRKASYPRLR